MNIHRHFAVRQVAPNSSCVVCGLSVRKDLDSASCRVCNKSFHEKCVRENYEVSRRDLEHMKNASTDVGWSCPECVNIFTSRYVGREQTRIAGSSRYKWKLVPYIQNFQDNIYNLLNAMEMSEVNQLFREIDANDGELLREIPLCRNKAKNFIIDKCMLYIYGK